MKNQNKEDVEFLKGLLIMARTNYITAKRNNNTWLVNYFGQECLLLRAKLERKLNE